MRPKPPWCVALLTMLISHTLCQVTQWSLTADTYWVFPKCQALIRSSQALSHLNLKVQKLGGRYYTDPILQMSTGSERLICLPPGPQVGNSRLGLQTQVWSEFKPYLTRSPILLPKVLYKTNWIVWILNMPFKQTPVMSLNYNWKKIEKLVPSLAVPKLWTLGVCFSCAALESQPYLMGIPLSEVLVGKGPCLRKLRGARRPVSCPLAQPVGCSGMLWREWQCRDAGTLGSTTAVPVERTG